MPPNQGHAQITENLRANKATKIWFIAVNPVIWFVKEANV